MTLVWCGLMTVNIGFAVIGVIVGGNLAKPLLSFALPMALLIAGIRIQQPLPGQIPCAIRLSNPRGKRASRIASQKQRHSA